MFPLFPFDTIRPVQKSFMLDLQKAIDEQRDFIAHAPTGLGKTAASLTPLLQVAKQKGFTIFFLTSRHTQHEIVLRTIRAIKEKHGTEIIASTMISKRLMCAQQGAQNMRAGDFASYCSALKEQNECSYYSNARQKNYLPTVQAAKTVKQLKDLSPVTSELIVEISEDSSVCPYESALILASSADVVICDYFYLFAPHIRENFLNKLGKKLSECIIVVDEGHNLSSRARELLTQRLTSMQIKRGIREAKEIEAQRPLQYMVDLQGVLTTLSEGMHDGQEKVVQTDEFVEALTQVAPVSDIVDALEVAALDVRMEKKNSVLGSIGKFLDAWDKGSDGYCRIISAGSFRGEPTIQLSKRCLDPALVTGPVIEDAFLTVLMSGTLIPTEMYRQVLGFRESSYEHIYESPFPDENRLCLIIPKTTTKYQHRSPQQYAAIAKILADIANRTPGCSAIFFPSYALLNNVAEYFNPQCEKTIFTEVRGMHKQEKQDMLARFSAYKKSGAVLLGVAAGSFGEGVDLPGVLRSVVVVGLPLDRPDLETKELIQYYNEKFGRGVDYGYILPALTRTLQNAGRCIRSETDAGALIFLDERYSWPLYRRCFPQDWNMIIHDQYDKVLDQFFE